MLPGKQNSQRPFEELWNPENNLEALEHNYRHTVEFVKTDLVYYKEERENCRTFSKLIKLLTILIIAVATVLPLLNTMSDVTDSVKLKRASWCFILLSIGGSLFLFDRYFGFTSKWIRLKTTELNLSIALSDFIQDWIIFLATVNGQFTKELYIQGQQKISGLRRKIDEIKKNEVQEWLKEYQQSMVELSSKIDAMSKEAVTNLKGITDARLTGSLVLKITNAQKFDSIEIKLDDVPIKTITKINESLLENLLPKHYSLILTGKIGVKQTSFDKIIEIKPNAVTTETVVLPE